MDSHKEAHTHTHACHTSIIRNKQTQNHPSALYFLATLVVFPSLVSPPFSLSPQFLSPSGCVKCCSVGVFAQTTSKSSSDTHTHTEQRADTQLQSYEVENPFLP